MRVIPPTVNPTERARSAHKQLRVAAYCRVSTKQEEQLNSYDVQKRFYTEKINSEPKWALVGIFADKGLSGTSTKKREEFNRMIRMCKRGKIDLILTKSISRFARNTVDCLKYVRMLRELKYSSKYALTELLVCGECGTPYRRCTWTASGEKKIVWRCINRLDHGKTYCPHSISVDEIDLQNAIVRALKRFNAEDDSIYLSLMKATIAEAIGLNGGSDEIDLLE